MNYKNTVFSRRFWRKVPDSYNGYFFKTRKVHFFVHLFNTLNYGGSKHSKPHNLVQNKTVVQNLENPLKILPILGFFF